MYTMSCIIKTNAILQNNRSCFMWQIHFIYRQLYRCIVPVQSYLLQPGLITCSGITIPKAMKNKCLGSHQKKIEK